MTTPDLQPKPAPQRSFLRDGGWIVLVLVGVITIGALYQVWLRYEEVRSVKAGVVGDGKHADSYGFDLTHLAPGVQRSMILPMEMPKDGLKSLDNPGHITLAENEAFGKQNEGRDKYVLPEDRVIGYSDPTRTHSFAYPIAVMNWHGVVNDQSNTGLTIFYDGECDLAMAFDTTAVWETFDPNKGPSTYWTWFGISGLAYNGQTLLYDKQQGSGVAGRSEHKPVPKQSLWMPLLMKPITGPLTADDPNTMSDKTFDEQPISVLQFRDWVAEHPDTTIVARDPNLVEDYAKDVYGPYYEDAKLPAGVSPQLTAAQLADLGGLAPKSRGIGLKVAGKYVFIPHELALAKADIDVQGLGQWTAMVSGRKLALLCRKASGSTPTTLWLAPDAQANLPADVEVDAPVVLLFAWYAAHPDTWVTMADGSLVQAK